MTDVQLHVQGLHHPHIVTFCGVCSESARTVMVTELLPFSLHDVLYSMPNVTVPPSNCVKIAIDVCRAFRYLHARTPQIIHRCATATPDMMQLLLSDQK
jgi:serine/threonine protein kinase